jgi:hypothetical protein
MPLTESLTVRILGDSSQLRRELSSVAAEIEALQERLSEAGNAGRMLTETFGRASSGLGGLQQLSAMLDRIIQQVQLLSRQPITLNVQPALGALQQLMSAAQRTALQLRALSMTSRAGAFVPAETAGGQGFAAGGLVTGPGGIDQIPARLTAGEFVLNREAAAALGESFLDRLNRGKARAREVSTATPVADALRRTLPAMPAEIGSATVNRVHPAAMHPVPAISQSTNHFGGIEIHVREATDVDNLLLDLRRRGIGLRNRRG